MRRSAYINSSDSSDTSADASKVEQRALDVQQKHRTHLSKLLLLGPSRSSSPRRSGNRLSANDGHEPSASIQSLLPFSASIEGFSQYFSSLSRHASPNPPQADHDSAIPEESVFFDRSSLLSLIHPEFLSVLSAVNLIFQLALFVMTISCWNHSNDDMVLLERWWKSLCRFFVVIFILLPIARLWSCHQHASAHLPLILRLKSFVRRVVIAASHRHLLASAAGAIGFSVGWQFVSEALIDQASCQNKSCWISSCFLRMVNIGMCLIAVLSLVTIPVGVIVVLRCARGSLESMDHRSELKRQLAEIDADIVKMQNEQDQIMDRDEVQDGEDQMQLASRVEERLQGLENRAQELRQSLRRGRWRRSSCWSFFLANAWSVSILLMEFICGVVFVLLMLRQIFYAALGWMFDGMFWWLRILTPWIFGVYVSRNFWLVALEKTVLSMYCLVHHVIGLTVILMHFKRYGRLLQLHWLSWLLVLLLPSIFLHTLLVLVLFSDKDLDFLGVHLSSVWMGISYKFILVLICAFATLRSLSKFFQ